jgi:hypothetical protein
VIRGLALYARLLVLRLSYFVHRRSQVDVDWIVGPVEVAGIVRDIGAAVPRTYTALLLRHPFYGDAYDWLPSAKRRAGLPGRLALLVRGPWLLGRLATRARGFIYVGADGFLPAGLDDRVAEFSFLARRGKLIVCLFTGTDIRSPKLMQELEEQLGEPNIATWLRAVAPGYDSTAYDEAKRRVGAVASRFADLVITAAVDQRGYLDVPTEPFRYFHPDAEVLDDLSKFDAPERITVVHAPSSPVIKGTQLVRAAVSALRAEGYDFEYVELTGVANSVVRENLLRAHIVLNEFYAYVPGVFAVEAMAAGCAVITRADETIETDLPTGSNAAWFVTRHSEVERHLRRLLDDHSLARAYAERGRDWVRQNAVASVTGKAMQERLDVLLHSAEGRRRP